MRTQRSTWSSENGWSSASDAPDAQWVLYFAARDAPHDRVFADLRDRHPRAILQGCTTGGEIAGVDVHDDTVSSVAVTFDAVRVGGTSGVVVDVQDSFRVGAELGSTLSSPDLRAIFVLSDGTRVNGTELVRGLRSTVAQSVTLTGGLAGDGARFGTTRVGLDDAPHAGRVAAVGLYGKGLVVGHGSAGGWVSFGPERVVTRSHGNVLLELDHRPALELYKKYLGDEARNLPASALLYPLVIRRRDGNSEALVRTVVGVDEAAHTMTFAGDVPEGAVVQLMRASLDELVDGAADAARSAHAESTRLAVLVSCIGRKLLMGQRTCDEVEAVADVLGAGMDLVGFYSYGEICPAGQSFSDLHNQTMTITTFGEHDG